MYTIRGLIFNSSDAILLSASTETAAKAAQGYTAIGRLAFPTVPLIDFYKKVQVTGEPPHVIFGVPEY